MKTFTTAPIAAIATAADVSLSVSLEFMEHLTKYGKSYITVEEFMARQELYAAVDAEIKEHNATDSLYKMGHNKFSDWTEYEKKQLKGHKPNPNKEVLELEIDETLETPKSVDWREKNAVTPVKD